LQRLFSTFPNSWPGVGLLLLRVCLAAALIAFVAVGPPSKTADAITVVQNAIAAVGAIFLIAGLWTPAIGILLAVEEASNVLTLNALMRETGWIHAFLAVFCVSAAMLGPGAWSLDARLFGRKRFHIDRTPGRQR
jgi:putative oxidoreductase